MNRDTICVQGGYTPGKWRAPPIPIIQSTTFNMLPARIWAVVRPEADGYFYSRLQNPLPVTLYKKIQELEGGTAAMLTQRSGSQLLCLVHPLRGW